jgi:neutral ceramidase
MGCGGDQDPAPRRSPEDAEQNGLALAFVVEAALSPEPMALSPSLAIGFVNCPLDFAPLHREELERRAQAGDGFVSRHARWVLKTWPKVQDHPESYQLPIHVITLGKRLTIVALDGEPVVDYSNRLKRELSANERRVCVVGYSNLVNAYIPNRRVLQEAG